MLAATTAELAAQGNGSRSRPTNPACPLVTEEEVEAATGLDYRQGDAIDQLGEGIGGGATCLWGGMSMVPGKDLPQIGVVFIPAGPRGSHTEWRKTARLLPGCTRESVRGVGDGALAEICEAPKRTASVSVYAKAGKNDVLVMVDQLQEMSTASAKPIALALARAAAARAKGR